MVKFRLLGVFAFGLLLQACSDDAEPAPPAPLQPPAPETPKARKPKPKKEGIDSGVESSCDDSNLADSIGKIEGVSNLTEEACGKYVDGPARCFTFHFRQLVDHKGASDGPTFDQVVQLVHRSCGAPTTVMDNGYGLPGVYYELEPSLLFDTNTFSIEHRYQGESIPSKENLKWTALTIENGAADVHAIVSAFKALYPKAWVSTGASKGGITAVYHRYFYPDDVNGTIAYVAPASEARADERYQTRLDSGVLPEPCASNVRAFQVGALGARRSAFTARVTELYKVTGISADYLLEQALATFDWGFWQYKWDCLSVPSATANDSAHLAYFDQVLKSEAGEPRVQLPASSEATAQAALSYEWGWQQGFALQVGKHIAGSFKTTAVADYQLDSIWATVFPKVPLPAFDGSITRKVRDWARDSAPRMLFIYGEVDPWTGGALDEPANSSSGKFIAAGEGHGANVSDLNPTDRTRAMDLATAMYAAPSSASMDIIAPHVHLGRAVLMEHESIAIRRAILRR